jgi:hypothetical protein
MVFGAGVEIGPACLLVDGQTEWHLNEKNNFRQTHYKGT